jgi:hypothetical protein
MQVLLRKFFLHGKNQIACIADSSVLHLLQQHWRKFVVADGRNQLANVKPVSHQSLHQCAHQVVELSQQFLSQDLSNA